MVVLWAASGEEALSQGNGHKDSHGLDPASAKITLDLERATTLVIQGNKILENLNLSGTENLTTLVVKGNDQLVQLNSVDLDLPQLTNVIIEDNSKLAEVKLSKLEVRKERKNEENQPPKGFFEQWIIKWRDILQPHDLSDNKLSDQLNLVIKDNDCLVDLNLEDLNNLRELRIEDNNNLKVINFDLQQSSGEEIEKTSSTSGDTPLVGLSSSGDSPQTTRPP